MLIFIVALHRHDDPPMITHCPLLDTLLHVAFCGSLYGTVLHIYPAEQFTGMFTPNIAGDGIEYEYGPEIVELLQSTAK